MNTPNNPGIPAGYADWLAELKTHVTAARQRAVLAANTELVTLYWQIGYDILQTAGQPGLGCQSD